MQENENAIGRRYENKRLGIPEDYYPINAQFVPEGKEKQIGPDMWIIGNRPSIKEGICGEVIIADSEGVIFVSENRVKRYSHKEIKP